MRGTRITALASAVLLSASATAGQGLPEAGRNLLADAERAAREYGAAQATGATPQQPDFGLSSGRMISGGAMLAFGTLLAISGVVGAQDTGTDPYDQPQPDVDTGLFRQFGGKTN